MGLWTVWVTGDRCLALVTCYNGLLQQGTNSGQTRRPIFFCFLSSQPMEMEWNGFLSCWIFICINTYFKPDIKYIYYNPVRPQQSFGRFRICVTLYARLGFGVHGQTWEKSIFRYKHGYLELVPGIDLGTLSLSSWYRPGHLKSNILHKQVHPKSIFGGTWLPKV